MSADSEDLVVEERDMVTLQPEQYSLLYDKKISYKYEGFYNVAGYITHRDLDQDLELVQAKAVDIGRVLIDTALIENSRYCNEMFVDGRKHCGYVIKVVSNTEEEVRKFWRLE